MSIVWIRTLPPLTAELIWRPPTYHVILGSGLPHTLHLKSTEAWEGRAIHSFNSPFSLNCGGPEIIQRCHLKMNSKGNLVIELKCFLTYANSGLIWSLK